MNGKWRQTKGEQQHKTATFAKHGIVDGILDVYRVCSFVRSFCTFCVSVFSFFVCLCSHTHTYTLKMYTLHLANAVTTGTTTSKNIPIQNGMVVIVIISLAAKREDTIK